MKKKNILFIDSLITAKSIRLGITGGEVRLAEIMRGFIEDDWEVHLLTNGGGKYFCELFGLNKVINHNFNIKEGLSRLWVLAFTIRILFKIPESLKNFVGYIYSANELLPDVIPALMIKKSNKENKWAAVVHWLPPLKFWQRKKSKFIISLLFMLGERLGVFLTKYFSDVILAVSRSTRRQLLNVGVNENKVFAVNCGVDFKRISKTVKKDLSKKYEAVFMKRIQAVKGVFDLIDIWELVIKIKPDAKLAIMGGESDNKELVNIIRERKLENNVIFFGPIFDFKKKFKILSQSKMFILPSYEENWAIVMGEAMACKIPVLAYNLLELVDAWQDSFVQIPLGDKKFFADKIIDYLDNKILKDKQAELGYRYVQQFEWTEIAKNEVNIIKTI